jgi:hypothetical protein
VTGVHQNREAAFSVRMAAAITGLLFKLFRAKDTFDSRRFDSNDLYDFHSYAPALVSTLSFAHLLRFQ